MECDLTLRSGRAVLSIASVYAVQYYAATELEGNI